MDNRQLAKKYELTHELAAIENKVAYLVVKQREALSKLIKLKNYATIKECNFRDKQLKKLIGERNG
jgi:ribosomal protein L7Ae-like RNA K-turn-binding protein|tara:strand:+ start:791 stop:988 length:198 start_codon:yes stop_codon:yes gene_type:complete